MCIFSRLTRTPISVIMVLINCIYSVLVLTTAVKCSYLVHFSKINSGVDNFGMDTSGRSEYKTLGGRFDSFRWNLGVLSDLALFLRAVLKTVRINDILVAM